MKRTNYKLSVLPQLWTNNINERRIPKQNNEATTDGDRLANAKQKKTKENDHHNTFTIFISSFNNDNPHSPRWQKQIKATGNNEREKGATTVRNTTSDDNKKTHLKHNNINTGKSRIFIKVTRMCYGNRLLLFTVQTIVNSYFQWFCVSIFSLVLSLAILQPETMDSIFGLSILI